MELLTRVVGPIATNVHVLVDPRSREAIAALPTREDVQRIADRLERAEATLLSEFRNYARREALRLQSLELRMADLAQNFIERLPPPSQAPE